MKPKTSKFITYLLMLFSFMFLFTLMATKVSADNATTDLYYPDRALGIGYDTEGKVNIGTLDIYAHNNGAGYQIDKTKHLRISKLVVTVGTTSKTYNVDEDNGNVPYITIDDSHTQDMPSNEEGYWTYKRSGISNQDKQYLDKISINMSDLLNADFAGVEKTNSVSITLSFQRANYIAFWISSWSDYNAVNVYKGSTQKNQTVDYVKTNSILASAAFQMSDVNVVCDGCSTVMVDGENLLGYNLSNLNSKKVVNIVTNVGYKASSIMVYAYYSDTENIVGVVNDGSRISIGLSDLLKIDVEKTKYIFNKFVFKVTDYYGITFTKTITNFSAKFVLDTKAPIVTSAGVSDDNGSVFYDVSEIYPIFNTSEKANYDLKKLKFTIGSENHTRECVDCNGVTENNSIIKTYTLSGNGEVKLTGFEMTLTDELGNQTKYTLSNSASKCTANETVEFVSSIKSVVTGFKYYYENETITFAVDLVSLDTLENLESIVLTFSDNSKYNFNVNEYVSAGNYVYYEYFVGNSKLTINTITFNKVNNLIIEPIYTSDLNIKLNEYLDLDVQNLVNPENKTFNIFEFDVEDVGYILDNTKITHSNVGIDSFTCSKDETLSTCSYTSKKDGIDSVVIEVGAIILSNGQQNSKKEFTLTINERAPSALTSFNSDNVVEYETKTYYKNGDSLITFTLSDDYAETLCLHYAINDGEFKQSCVNDNIGNIVINLPFEDGEYTISYYTSDGVNGKIEDKRDLIDTFVYRGDFKLGDIKLKVNDVLVNNNLDNIAINNDYNHIDVVYENGGTLDLLNEVRVSLEVKNGITKYSNNPSDTINIFKGELLNIDDIVNVKIELIDKLGNSKVYIVGVNVDTILPSFTNIVAQIRENSGLYTVTISGYDEYALKIEVDGVGIELSSGTFTTENEKFTVYLEDKAGNINSKVFTTVSPYIELFNLDNDSYEINISPFDSTIHTIEDYKYLVFDYDATISNSDIKVAQSNVCTAGRKIKCYIEGNFTPYSAQIEQTFTKGYSYIILVKVNNVLVNAKNSSNLPRLDIVAADNILPDVNYLDEDTNPDYISSVSGSAFNFGFMATDANLSSNYYYLVTKSDLNMNVAKFYDLYKSCYGATSSSNGCGIRGENTYVSEITGKDNTYLGEVSIIANNNTKKRLVDETVYSLYVLVLDEGNNEVLFKVRDFVNISKSSVIKYFDDSSRYVTINSGEEVSTVNTTRINISRYNEIQIESLRIDGNNRVCDRVNGCSYDLNVGKHIIEVKDVLGNISIVTIYSAAANNPIIQVEYEYQGVYYKISDNSFSYNADNASKVYIKVISKELESVRIGMINNNVYQSGDTVFDRISDSNSLHGINLLDLMELCGAESYTGDITISSQDVGGGITSVVLVVDNSAPEITLALPGSHVNLMGNQYLLTIDALSGKYKLTYNYQSEITYGYLFDALSIKIDNTKITSMLDINRLKITVDGNALADIDASITKGTKIITIDYFDNAGNVATQKIIDITVIDNEKPNIVLNNAPTWVELNVPSLLANVLVSDNHDSELNVVATINGEEIDYTNYKFTSLGDYVVTYIVTDSSSNSNYLTQTILVRDTTGPVLKEGTITEYTIGLNKELVLDLPVFVDNDTNEYLPYEVKILDLSGEIINDTLASYPLVSDASKVKIRFSSEYSYKLGMYQLIFVVKDNANNANESLFEITLTDDSEPEVEIKINNRVANEGSVNTFPWGAEIVVSASANDANDGDLTSRITKTIKFNGASVSKIDTSISGDYVVEFKVKDKSNNEKIATITIRISKDETKPIIDKVLINGVELIDNSINKIGGYELTFVVEAHDDSNQVESKVSINDEYIMESGSTIRLESGLNGVSYKVVVTSVDSSGNLISKTYTLVVDNTAPSIGGISNNTIYSSSVKLIVYDDNISEIKILKNGSDYQRFDTNISEFEISDIGIYMLVAKDTYGNVSTFNFVITNENKYMVIDSDNNTNEIVYNHGGLIETIVEGNKLTFVLSNNPHISKNDQIYILVNYPEGGYKYVAYSMNGQTYLSKNKVSVELTLVDGQDNVNLLEKVGDKYYSYLMIVKGNEEPINDNKDDMESNAKVGKIVLTIIAIILGIGLVYLIIKIRRRVRAV